MATRREKTRNAGLRKVNARRLEELRIAKPRGWTEEELEAQSGVSRSTLVRIATDLDYRAQPRTVQRLADALGVRAEELYERDERLSDTLQIAEIGGRSPPGLDEWLRERALDVTKRQEAELRQLRIGFTREPPANTDWRLFWERVWSALRLLDQATGDA